MTVATMPGAYPAAYRPAGKPWSVDELATFLGCSARHLWRLIHDERVKSIRLGARVMVADDEARRVAREGV